MRNFIYTVIAVVAVLGVATGFYAGARQAQAEQTTWGNVKCRYSPTQCQATEPKPTTDPVDNKNQG